MVTYSCWVQVSRVASRSEMAWQLATEFCSQTVSQSEMESRSVTVVRFGGCQFSPTVTTLPEWTLFRTTVPFSNAKSLFEEGKFNGKRGAQIRNQLHPAATPGRSCYIVASRLTRIRARGSGQRK